MTSAAALEVEAPRRPVLDLRKAAIEVEALDKSELPELSAVETRLIENTWRGRMVNEHVSARVFGFLVGQAMEAGEPPERQEALLGFAQDELRHARACAGVLSTLGFEAVGSLPPLPAVPRHEEVEPREAYYRNILSVCCLSETVASALISVERLALRPSPLSDVLGSILADEVQHARFGWRLLEAGDRSDAFNRRLDSYLAIAFAHLERHELDHLAPVAPPSAAIRWGACDGATARNLFYDTVEAVIIPRLEQHGLRAEEAWATRATA